MKYFLAVSLFFSAILSPVALAAPGVFSQQGAGANDQVEKCWGRHNESLERQVVECTNTINSGAWAPQDALRILLHRAGVYRKMGQFDHEMADIDLAVAVAPRIGRSSQAEAYNARCYARAMSGQELDTALSDCNAALAIHSDDSDILDSRCLVYFRMANYSAAIADCDAAIKGDQKSSTSLYVRGLSKSKTGDTAGGNADITAAEAIDPKVADVFAGYGVKP